MVTGLSWGQRGLIDKVVAAHFPADKTHFNLTELQFIYQQMNDQGGIEYFNNDVNINRGYHILRNFVKHLLYRNLANYDSMLLISSEKGTGKSSAALMIAREWCKLLGIRFNPARHIAYNNSDVMTKIDLLNPFEPLIADESVRFACIVGETKIKVLKGDIEIKDLVNKENFEVYSYNEKTKKEEIQIAGKCIKVREDVVYEIETENGYKIQATKEHKFLTINGWKKLEELKEGDELVGI